MIISMTMRMVMKMLMLMMLKIEMIMMIIMMLDDGVSSHSRPIEIGINAHLLQCSHVYTVSYTHLTLPTKA